MALLHRLSITYLCHFWKPGSYNHGLFIFFLRTRGITCLSVGINHIFLANLPPKSNMRAELKYVSRFSIGSFSKKVWRNFCSYICCSHFQICVQNPKSKYAISSHIKICKQNQILEEIILNSFVDLFLHRLAYLLTYLQIGDTITQTNNFVGDAHI